MLRARRALVSSSTTTTTTRTTASTVTTSSNFVTARCHLLTSSPRYSANNHVRAATGVRCLSTNSNGLTTDDNTPTVDATLDRLFADDATTTTTTTAATDALTDVVDWAPSAWYNLADQAVWAVQTTHEYFDLEYGWSIVAVTAALRIGLFPILVQAQRTSSRMAHLQPELNQLKQRYEAMGDQKSRQEQVQFGERVQALFKRYEVNPLQALLPPLFQLPLFMGMFFGLRKMPDIFPNELATGGMLWFTDLTVPDPLYILPLLSSGTMLLMVEVNKEQMSAAGAGAAGGPFMVNFMRIASVVSVPAFMSFNSCMVCYWTANNVLTLGQSLLLQTKALRNAFGIWERPKPVPGQGTPSLQESVQQMVQRVQGQPTTDEERMQQHNRAVENKKRAAAHLVRNNSATAKLAASRRKTGITGTRNK